jgi:hypothetical protein
VTEGSFEAIEGSSRRPYRIDLEAEGLRLVPLEGGAVIELSRAALDDSITILDGLIIRRMISFPKEEGKPVFRLSKAHFEQLLRWLGPPSKARLTAEIRRRTRALVPIALLFVLTSLPCPGDASSSIQAIPFDLSAMILGLGLIVIFGVGRLYPHRVIFLLDAIWWIGLATDNFHGISTGKLGGFGLALAVVALIFSFSALKLFAHYKPWPSPESPPL